MYETVDAVFANLHYDKEACGEELCIFFEIQGEASHLLHIKDGDLKVHRLPKYVPSESLYVNISSEDLLDCVNEKTDLQMLLIQGKLHVDGELSQVLRLPAIFPKGDV